MKYASIDIGTNSIRILILQKHERGFDVLERQMAVTRVGEGFSGRKAISEKSAKRTLNVLKNYMELMKKNGVTVYKAVGTSAVREAENKDWFISYILKNSGIKIEPVSGDREAWLSFYGATRDMGGEDKNMVASLVIDIGGGSSEFILGSHSGKLDFLESVNIGCVNLTEKFIAGSKPSGNEIRAMETYIEQKLKKTIKSIVNFTEKNRALSLVGVTGTITTLAAIDLKLLKYDSEKIHHHLLDVNTVQKIFKNLCSLDAEARKKVIGLQTERADIIIAGVAILLRFMEGTNQHKILVSERDILDGIIYTMADF